MQLWNDAPHHSSHAREVNQGSSATTTRFLYDGDALIAEYDGLGNMLRREACAELISVCMAAGLINLPLLTLRAFLGRPFPERTYPLETGMRAMTQTLHRSAASLPIIKAASPP